MDAEAISEGQTKRYWFVQGMRGIWSIPAIMLMLSFVGFAAFTAEGGIPVEQVMFMTGVVWALPAKVILVGSMLSGANLATTFIAVTLSSVRMMPMVAALVPEIRNSKTPTWLMLLLSHFVAITAWVFATQNLSKIPREARAAWFAGFGITLTVVNAIIVGLCYGVVAAFPPLVAGVLFFLTPVYFIASIWATARHSVVKVAFIIGVIAGPVFAVIAPEFDILYAGIGGGTVAYLIDRFVFRRKIIPVSPESEP